MVCFILPPPPQPLQAVCWVRTLWPRWGTPWGLGRESLSGCSKVERDSCTADPAVVVRAALGVHDCHRRPQQRARGLHDKETCCLFAKTDNHCSIRWEPWGELVPKTGANSRIIKYTWKTISGPSNTYCSTHIWRTILPPNPFKLSQWQSCIKLMIHV